MVNKVGRLRNLYDTIQSEHYPPEPFLWSVACQIFSDYANFGRGAFGGKENTLWQLTRLCYKMSSAEPRAEVYDVENRPDLVASLRILLDILHVNATKEGEVAKEYVKRVECLEQQLPKQSQVTRLDYALEDYRGIKVLNVTEIFALLKDYKHHFGTRISSVVLANLCSIKAEEKYWGVMTEEDAKQFNNEMLSIIKKLED